MLELLRSEPDRALGNSQEGPGAAAHLTALPTEPGLRLEPHREPHSCTCGATLDTLGDHRAACPTSGLLRLRSGPPEKAWARILREAGGRCETTCRSGPWAWSSL